MTKREGAVSEDMLAIAVWLDVIVFITGPHHTAATRVKEEWSTVYMGNCRPLGLDKW